MGPLAPPSRGKRRTWTRLRDGAEGMSATARRTRSLASSRTGGVAARLRVSTISSSPPSMKAIPPIVKSISWATRAMTEATDSSKRTILRATRPISERTVAS